MGEVAITVTPVSDAQPFARTDTIQVDEGATVSVLTNGDASVLANDSGLVDEPITLAVLVAPKHASAFQLLDDGTFSYSHDGSETREDSFTYQVRDFDAQVSSATVKIEIAPTDDGEPEAQDDRIELREGSSTQVTANGQRSLLANDSILDTLTNVSVLMAPEHARRFFINADGTFSYTHDGTEQFSDSFTYQITDLDGDTDVGTVIVDVTPVSDARPVAVSDTIDVVQNGSTSKLRTGLASVLDNDRSLVDAPVVVTIINKPENAFRFRLNADGTFLYQHDGTRTERDSFRYELRDTDGQTSRATVFVNIGLDQLGDFNRDGQVDAADLDLLFAAINRNELQTAFDLNGDQSVNSLDVDLMLSDILRIRPGDANLDGEVGFADFLTMSISFGANDATWEDGDFDGDGRVSFADFLVLSQNFGGSLG